MRQKKEINIIKKKLSKQKLNENNIKKNIIIYDNNDNNKGKLIIIIYTSLLKQTKNSWKTKKLPYNNKYKYTE